MSIPILHNLNLNGNQLIAARLETLGTAPTSGNLVAGRVIYNSGIGITAPQYYDGTNWVTLSRKGVFADLPALYIGKTKVTDSSQSAAIVASGFKIDGGADTSVLTAGGGSKTISSLSVATAANADNATAFNGYTGALGTEDASATKVLVVGSDGASVKYRLISELSVNYAASAGKTTNALSWSGYSSGSFDGSAAKSLSIPTASSFYGTYDSRYLKLSGGTISAGAKVYFNGGTEAWIEYDATADMFKFSKGIYSLGQVCAGGSGSSSGGGGGSDYDRLDTWDGYTSDMAGYVLSAGLGKGLKDRIETLEGGSAMNITIGTVGESYAISGVSKSGTTLAFTTSRFAPLDDSGKVSSAYLPSYVDDVLEYDSMSDFPAASAAEEGKIYVAKDTNKTYRWGGSTYVEISASLAIGTTTGTAYDGASGAALATSLASLTTKVNNIKVYDATITVSHSVANGASSRGTQTFTLNQSSDKKITVYDTWRPVVDNLTSSDTTSSLSANQGKVLNSSISNISTILSSLSTAVSAKPAEHRYTISSGVKTYTTTDQWTNAPAVSLWDASGNLVLTDIKYSSNKLTVTFATATTQAYTLVAIGN